MQSQTVHTVRLRNRGDQRDSAAPSTRDLGRRPGHRLGFGTRTGTGARHRPTDRGRLLE